MSWIKCGGTLVQLVLLTPPNEENKFQGTAICPVCNYVVTVLPSTVGFRRTPNQVVEQVGSLKTHYTDRDGDGGMTYRKPKDLDPPEESNVN